VEHKEKEEAAAVMGDGGILEVVGLY